MSEDRPTYRVGGLSDRLAKDMKWGPWTIDIAVRANFRCEYCDRDLLLSVDAYKEWQHDHIIPKSVDEEKEKDRPENLAFSCRACNWDFKKKWDPSDALGDNPSREELIRVTREYVARKRTEAMVEVLKVRQIVYG